MRAMHKDEQIRGAPRPGGALLAVLTANLALGIIFLVYLLVLPSDPENALVGRYSQDRVLLLAGILAAIIAFASLVLALSVKRPRRQSLGETVLGENGMVKRILPFSPLLLASLFAVAVIFLPEQLEGLTTYHYSRLAPYLLWPLAFALSFAAGYWVLWHRPRMWVSSKAAEGGALLAIFLLSFAARASLSGYGLPYQSVWDEVVTYPRALELISGKTILENGGMPGYGRASYGDLGVYVTAAGQVAGLLAKLRTGAVYSVGDFISPAAGVSTVFEAVHVSGAPLQYPRLLFSLITSVCPLLVYLALRRYFGLGAWASLAGAVMLAILSPDIVYYSAFILPDALATTMAVGAAIAGMEVIRSRGDTYLPELACGALVGASLSMSIRYASLVAIPLAAMALAQNHRRWPGRLAIMAGGLVLAFLITSPTLLRDLPGYLGRLAGLTWVGDDSLPNRIVSLSFYLRGAFLRQGLGPVVLGLSLVGYTFSLQRRRRLTLFLTIVAFLHLLLITPTLHRVTRHALVLYPMVAIFAAAGLDLVEGHLPDAWDRLQMRLFSRIAPSRLSPRAAAPIVFLVFLGVSLPQIYQTARYIEDMRAFKPSQVQVAEYIRAHLKRDTSIALLEIVPFADVHLRRSHADIHRVGMWATLADLRHEGYEYVIATDRIGPEYGDAKNTVWVSELLSGKESVAEFGSADLMSRGWPLGNIYLYLARVPPLEP